MEREKAVPEALNGEKSALQGLAGCGRGKEGNKEQFREVPKFEP